MAVRMTLDGASKMLSIIVFRHPSTRMVNVRQQIQPSRNLVLCFQICNSHP